MLHGWCGKIVNGLVLRKLVFACVVGKNQKTPKLSPMADDAITRGGIGGLGSLVYICGSEFIAVRRSTSSVDASLSHQLCLLRIFVGIM